MPTRQSRVKTGKRRGLRPIKDLPPSARAAAHVKGGEDMVLEGYQLHDSPPPTKRKGSGDMRVKAGRVIQNN